MHLRRGLTARWTGSVHLNRTLDARGAEEVAAARHTHVLLAREADGARMGSESGRRGRNAVGRGFSKASAASHEFL